MPDAGDHEGENVGRPQELTDRTLLNRSIPSPLASGYPRSDRVVFFAEEIERRDEAHPEEERVARLRDIRGVLEVVVAVAFVIRGSQGEKQRAEPV